MFFINNIFFKYNKNFGRKSSAGFSVSEIVIAISILSFGIVLVYSAFSVIVITTYNISSRFTAAYLVQEGLEIVRNLRDNNFINMVNDPSNPNLAWSTGLVGTVCNTGCAADYKAVNSTQLISYNDNVFLGLNQDGFYSYDAPSAPTPFKRKIIISPVLGTSDALHVSVIVFWSYSGQSFSFDADEYLYNWH